MDTCLCMNNEKLNTDNEELQTDNEKLKTDNKIHRIKKQKTEKEKSENRKRKTVSYSCCALSGACILLYFSNQGELFYELLRKYFSEIQ